MIKTKHSPEAKLSKTQIERFPSIDKIQTGSLTKMIIK